MHQRIISMHVVLLFCSTCKASISLDLLLSGLPTVSFREINFTYHQYNSYMANIVLCS